MSVVSAVLPPGTPITLSDLRAAAADLGVAVKPTDESDLHVLLAALHEQLAALDQLDDYVPEVDLQRFPREGGREVTAKENENGAWAYKVRIYPTLLVLFTNLLTPSL